MKVEYRCNYCFNWVKSLEELELHRYMHNSDIDSRLVPTETVVVEIADTKTDTGKSK